MTSEFVLTRRVEFSDTDMAGIAHFVNYFRWMEEAEHAFVRSLGHDVHADDGETMHGFARVRATCEYTAPLRYPDEFQVRLAVRERTRSTIGYEFRFEQMGAVVATGALTVCCIGRGPGDERLGSRPIPEDLASKIEVAAPAP